MYAGKHGMVKSCYGKVNPGWHLGVEVENSFFETF